MRITDLLLPEAVRLHASPADKSAAIAIGSVARMFMLGLLKKKKV